MRKVWKDLNFMKTYDSERKDLNDWLLKKRSECVAAEEKENPKGLDSKSNNKFQLYVKEYNRKLESLKEKYNID